MEELDTTPEYSTRESNSGSDTYSQRQMGSFGDPETEKKNSLDDLTDQQLISHVQEKQKELRHVRLENKLLMHFMQNNDPIEMEGFENTVKIAIKKVFEKRLSPFLRLPMNIDFTRGSVCSSRRSSRVESFSSVGSIFEGRGPKINRSCKSDMVLKTMEEIQSNLTIFLKKSLKLRRSIKAELEEYAVREKDITESKESFEFNILEHGVDPLTQRIPAEKFLRWMEEWLKSAQSNIEKLRLRTASLKIQFRKVSAILILRQELGQNVHAVDFDQLEIENKHFAERFEQKNTQLIELKKMSGSASLILTNTKKQLRKLQDEYNGLKAQVAERERIIDKTEKACEKIEEELEKSRLMYNGFRRLTVSYKVPDVIEYVNIKSQLTDLKNKMKVWHRRKKIQDITLNACLRQMKNITGSSKIHQSWLVDYNAESTLDSIDDDEDEVSQFY